MSPMLLDISLTPKNYRIRGFILDDTDHTLETLEFNVYSTGWMRDGNSIALWVIHIQGRAVLTIRIAVHGMPVHETV